MPRQNLRRNLQAMCLTLNALVIIYPPPAHVSNNLIDFVRSLLAVLLLLMTILSPPPASQPLPIMQHLDPAFFGFDFEGRDMFIAIENQRYLFWLNTGELPETLANITAEISFALERLNRRGRLRRRWRMCKLSPINRVLLTMLWLRKYPCVDTLALLFDISPSTVSAIIHRIVPVLWHFFRNQVTWPSVAEWENMRGNWRSFPDAVGCIDGTPHEIYRPETEPQENFYSGHRHYHLMNTQLIVDNIGNIVFLQAGFLGAMNDAGELQHDGENWTRNSQRFTTRCCATGGQRLCGCPSVDDAI